MNNEFVSMLTHYGIGVSRGEQLESGVEYEFLAVSLVKEGDHYDIQQIISELRRRGHDSIVVYKVDLLHTADGDQFRMTYAVE